MINTTVDSLDLYARVEDLLGIQEVAPKLYAHYFLFLNSITSESLLDVGCGSGDFLVQMQHALNIPIVKGIDISPLMVSKTLKRGIDTRCIDLCDVKETYDVITAVFDVLNYLNKKQLRHFLLCVKERLNKGGYFSCDINTLFGFKNVAVGAYIVDNEERFLAIDSDFVQNEYISKFTFFEKENECFKKSQANIVQYYHCLEELATVDGLELMFKDSVDLYDLGEPDKVFVVLKKI